MELPRNSGRAAGLDLPARGDLLGHRYRVVRPLGSGGDGAVFLARDTARGDVPVVLKRLDRGADPRELELLDGLDHPHLLVPRSLVRVASGPFLVMPYCPGGDLDEWAGGRTLPERLRAGVEILRGLAALHQRGIVHRDIKASNVLCDGQGRMRIADFGLARPAGPAAGAAGGVSGTAGALAPELLRGEAPTAASDMYAFAALLRSLLSPERPPAHPTAAALLHAAMQRTAGEPVSPELTAELPDDGAPLRRLLVELSSPRPGARPGALAAAERLRACLPSIERPQLETDDSLAARCGVSGFFGREALWERLAPAALGQEGALGLPRLVWLVGEPGSGRTTLVESVRRRALLAGVHVPEIRPPEDARLLHRWLMVPPPSEPGTGDLDDIVDQVGSEILARARETPWLLAVDDVHEAPRAVAALIRYVLRNRTRASERLSILLSVPAGMERHPLVESLRDPLAPFSAAEDVRLEPLPIAAVRALCEALSPSQPVPEAFVGDLHRLTRGNPGLVQAALHGFIRGALAPLAAGLGLPDRLDADALHVPDSLSEAAIGCVRRSGEEEVACARLLAFLGGRCDRDTFLRLADGLAGAEAVRRVTAGARGALIGHADGPLGPELVVPGAALEQCLRGLGPAGERAALQLRIADALEAEGPSWAPQRARLLGAAGRPEAAARWAVEAGEWAFAVGWLEMALAAPVDPSEESDLLSMLALAEAHLGEFERARHTLCRVLGTADDRRPPEGGPRPPGGALYLRVAEVELGAGALRQALDVLESVHEPRDPWHAALAARAHLLLGEYDRSMAALGEGGSFEGSDPLSALGVHRGISRALVLMYKGRYEEAIAAAETLAARARSAPGPVPEHAMLLNTVGIVLQRRGRLREASEHYRASLEVARRQRDLARAGIATMNLGTVSQEQATCPMPWPVTAKLPPSHGVAATTSRY